MRDSRDPALPRRARRRPGFTLIELLIVCSILAVAVGAIGACVAGGIRVWEADAAFALGLMERDLMNAFRFPPVGFRGGEQSLSFPGFVRVPPDGDTTIGSVEYALAPAASRILRTGQPYGGQAPDAETVLSRVSRFDLQYDALAWPEEGSAPPVYGRQAAPVTNFPDRVTIRLGLTDGAESVEIVRTVVLPVGRIP
ncbi:type II secretion system protein J [Verrucomicrobiota bacterium]